MSYRDGLVTWTSGTSAIRSDDGSCGGGLVGRASMSVCVEESVGSLHVQGGRRVFEIAPGIVALSSPGPE